MSAVNGWLDEGHVRTYLHCRAGMQRSASVAAGVIALRDGVDIDEALRRVASGAQAPIRCPTSARIWRAGGGRGHR